jgi:hypothetical protein
VDGGALPTAPPQGAAGAPPRPTEEPTAGYRDDYHEGDGDGYGTGYAGADWEDDDEPSSGDTRRAFWNGILVGAAVVSVIAVAAFVLIDRNKSSDSTTSAATTTTSTSTTSTTLPPTTTTTTNPGRPANQVRVRVINASGAMNAATMKMAQLTPLGYQNAGLADGPLRKGTAVQCRTGFAPEAATLAKNVGGGAVVEPFPTPDPAGSANADCLVILGTA